MEIDRINSRIEIWKARQSRRRRILVQHLLSDDPLDSISESSNNFKDKKRLRLFRRSVRLFDIFKQEIDESVLKKRLLLPAISRLTLPRAGEKLKKLLNRQRLDTSLRAHNFRLNPVDFPNNGSDSLPDVKSGDTPDADSFVVKSYTGSATFLKGTQSANPHNDYSQHFVDTGERPQNFIRDTGLKNRFEEYPKLKELIKLKDELIDSRATPPMYLKTDLRNFDLTRLGSQFDVVLIEPPLQEYQRSSIDDYWTWDEIERLEIERIISPRSFVWIWCGAGEGLDAARKCLRKWGFRRCEDICWIKTNQSRPGHQPLEPNALFQRTKEHCLMGIHGTVRRSTDTDFIHANVDIDLIIGPGGDSQGFNDGNAVSGHRDNKPVELFRIIEHFCLGRRRLHLFGRDSTLRPGWLTLGTDLSASNFDSRLYQANFTKEESNGGGLLLGSSDEIDRLRPKSPPPRQQQPQPPNQQSTIPFLSGVGGGLPPSNVSIQQPSSNLLLAAAAAAAASSSGGRVGGALPVNPLLLLSSSLGLRTLGQSPALNPTSLFGRNPSSLPGLLASSSLLQTQQPRLPNPLMRPTGLPDASRSNQWLAAAAQALTNALMLRPPRSSASRR